jgi:hypothetical protein
MDAADLAEKSYVGSDALPPLRAKNTGTAQAYLTMDDVLVIPGTNEFADWTKYNLQAFNATGAQVGWGGANPAIAAAKWHFGFARHALEVAIFMSARVPKYIIGHSLGAGSAQILAVHYQVPTICFASPRPCFGTGPLPGEGWAINLVNNADIIGGILAAEAGFRRIGSVRGLSPTIMGGLHHSMADYKPALAARLATGSLDPDWPPKP